MAGFLALSAAFFAISFARNVQVAGLSSVLSSLVSRDLSGLRSKGASGFNRNLRAADPAGVLAIPSHTHPLFIPYSRRNQNAGINMNTRPKVSSDSHSGLAPLSQLATLLPTHLVKYLFGFGAQDSCCIPKVSTCCPKP